MTTENTGSNDHYRAEYQLTPEDIKKGTIKIDPYFVAKQWRCGVKDPSGALFHQLKTIARFGEKNSRERETRALYNQIKRFAELEGIDLEPSK